MTETVVRGLPPKGDAKAVDDSPLGAEGRLGRILLTGVAASVLVFLCLPIIIVVPMSFSSASSLQFPPPGLSLRWYESFFNDASWLAATRTSVIIASASSVLALVLGSLAAYGLVRGRFWGRGLLRSNFIAPMVIPAVVVAVALYIAFAQVGLLGTRLGLVLGHALLGVPYVVLVMSVGVAAVDVQIEQVARSLGASWPTTLLRVVLPNLLPSAFAAWVFAFIVSFDEVIVTLFIAGTHETIPKRMFNELILQVNPTITAIATLLIAFSLVAMGAIGLVIRRYGTTSSS